MSSKTVHRITSTLLSFLALSAALPLTAQAEEYLNMGIKLFGQKRYAESRPYFDKAAENAPWDSNAFYYQALSAQYCRDFNSAKKLWAKVIEKFPGTPACANATQAMRTLDPGYFTRAHNDSTPGSTAASASPASAAPATNSDDEMEQMMAKAQFQGPAQARIPISRVDGHVIVDVQINNRGAKADFSGSSSALSLKDAKALQITKADRSPLKSGDKIPVSVRLGDITATSFPITVEDTEKTRIGDDFFRKFSYQLDPSVLIVTKKQQSSGKTAYDVPFRKTGADMYIDLQLNGRKVTMLFDPKNGETVVPAKRAREFGLDVEEKEDMAMWNPAKQEGPLRGDPGFGEVKTKTSAEAKVNVGPVNNQVISVKIDDKAKEAKVGTDAFGSWKYTIDPSASLLRFSR